MSKDLLKIPEKTDNLINDNIEDPNYWKSFGELHNDPEFIKAKKEESEESIAELGLTSLSKVSRRKFLALLSASAALAAAGCTAPGEPPAGARRCQRQGAARRSSPAAGSTCRCRSCR